MANKDARALCYDALKGISKYDWFCDSKNPRLVWTFVYWKRAKTASGRDAGRKDPVFVANRHIGWIRPTFSPVFVETLLKKLPAAVEYVDES